MNKFTIIGLFLLASSPLANAQVSGGAGTYRNRDNGGIDALNIERSKRVPGKTEIEDISGATYLDAAVLMNVKADEYVAVFALFAEGDTPATASERMNSTLNNMGASLDALGVATADRNVDYISQSRTYAYEITTSDKPDDEGNLVLATEKPSGFELKKNLSVRFRDITKLDELVAAAARAEVYDLVKVDYFVKDMAAIQEKLQMQTMNLIRQKSARYEANLGLKLGAPTQIVADKPGAYFPVDQYASYTAAEAEDVRTNYTRSRTTVVSARKSYSTYFSPLNGDGFDAVINPVIVEPVVQFTTYIKVKFAAPKKK